MENEISRMLDFKQFEELDNKNSSVSIEQSQITGSFPVFSGGELKLTLGFPENCKFFKTNNYCIEIQWPNETLKNSLEEILKAHLLSVDKVSIWKTIESDETENSEESQKEQVKLLASKIFLFAITIVSLVFILLFLVFFCIKNINKTSRKTLFAFVFWFLYAIIVRIFLVEPSQVNNYFFLMGDTWQRFYPEHGFTFPLLVKSVVYLFPDSYLSLMRTVIVLGSLSVPMLFLLVKIITNNKTVAHFAAFILALLPLHVKLSSGDSEHVVLLFFYVLGLISWIKASENRNWLLFLVTVACSFCVIQCRPEAIHFPLTYIFFTRNLRQVPKSMWLVAVMSSVVFVLTGLIHMEQNSFGAKLHTSGEYNTVFYMDFHMLLTNLLGSGVAERSSEITIMIKDALLGIWPEIIGNKSIWRPHYLIQWVPLVFSPFLIIGIFWNARKLQFWSLPLTVIFIRLPSWFSNNLGLKQGMEYFDSRYYIVSILFQLVLIAFGFYYFLKFLQKINVPKPLITFIVALLLFIFVSALPRPYLFRFTYQEEAAFLCDSFNELPPNAVVTHLDPNLLGEKLLELDVRPFLSLVKLSRPDITICRSPEKKAGKECRNPEYYLELAQCQLSDTYFKERVFEEHWVELLESSNKIVKACDKYKKDTELELIASKQVRLQDFGGNFYLEPVFVPVNLYRIIKK